jgi:hypothetical protein
MGFANNISASAGNSQCQRDKRGDLTGKIDINILSFFIQLSSNRR